MGTGSKIIIALELVVLFLIIVGIGVAGYFVYQSQNKAEVTSIEMNQQLVDYLNEKFLKSNDTEFAICLNGEQIGNKLLIEGYEESIIIGISTNEEISIKCPFNWGFNTVGTIHNHNSGLCKMSAQDIFTLGNSRHKMMGIICGEDKISLYTPNNIIVGVDLSINE